MMADNCTMEEMLQAPTEVYGDAIVVPDILAENFEIKTGLLSLIQANQFYGFESNNPHDRIRSFNRITSTLKFRDVPNDAIKLILFPYSLEGAAKICTDVRIDKLMEIISTLVKTFNKKMTTPAMVKAVEETCVICGGAHPYYDCIAIDRNISSVCATMGTYNQGNSLQSNTIPNPRADFKAITTRSGVTLAGPSVSPSLSTEENQKPETIMDQELTESTNNVPPLVVQPSSISTSFSTISFSKIPEVTKDTVQPNTENIQPLLAQTQVPIDEPVVGPKPKLTIPYPSRANKQKLREKDDMLALKFVEIFRNLHLELSFVDALLHMPKFALIFKILLNNKEKLFDLVMTPVKENCSVVILKKKLSLPELTSTQMILELAGRSTTRPAGIAEDVFVKVGKFHFLTDFVVIDYVVDTRVPLILGRPFLRSGRNLIDIYGDILYLENLLTEYPSPNLPPVKTIDLKQFDATMTRPSIEKAPDLELKELPSHLKYAFLEGTDKLPVIISKEPKDEEKSALLKVLKSHKRVIAWKIFDIKDGFSGYFQISIDPQDQEKTTFTCPYGTFAYRRMPFSLCNAPGTFQRCMMAIFHDMIEETMKVFMDDFSVFGDSFSSCLSNLDTMLKWCEDTNLVLNWEKCHFVVNEGIVLGHKISKNRLEVDRAKVIVISKLPLPTTVKGVRSFLGHADCIDAFETLKKKLIEAPILVVPDWNLPFELMCDASDFAIGAILGKQKTKHF
nr:reverse transcriptase domain-containing protein [Tanacetum cinerariifolium]